VLNDGMYVLNPKNGQTQAILSGTGSYKQLKFNDAGTMLAFVSNRDEIAKIKEKNCKTKSY